MRLKDINTDIRFDLWVKPEYRGVVLEKGIGFIAPIPNSDVSYSLIVNGKLCTVVLSDYASGIDLNFHLKRGCAHLAEVVRTAQNGYSNILITFFYGEVLEFGEIEIGIDDKITETSKRSSIRFNNADHLGELLKERCTITTKEETFFLVFMGTSSDSGEPIEKITRDQVNAFSILGERVKIPVSRQKKSAFEEILAATRIEFVESMKKEGAVRLARGKVKFTDWTKTGRLQALASGLMNQLTKETGSYLKHWDDYGDIEGEMLLERAKAIGRIDFTNFEVTPNGIKFFTTSKIEGLRVDEQLDVTSVLPPYIRDPQMDWSTYSAILESEYLKKENNKNSEGIKVAETISAKIISLHDNSLVLGMNIKPSKEMFLTMSISGDETQIKRRIKARKAIVEGKSANPLLGLIIEEGGKIPHPKRSKKIKPLSDLVLQKIFSHPPTEKQVEAIDIALNTTDIALIQGPPGTGKTTVITAILERLNEEHDKSASVRGQVLVSGLQHDAVNNIVSRLSLNSLPAVKFGRRSTDSEFADDTVTNKIGYWSTKVAERIRENNPNLNVTEEQKRLSELFSTYALSPSQKNTRNLLQRIADIPEVLQSKELSDRVAFMLAEMGSIDKTLHTSIIQRIRSLRIREASFSDDGSETAMALLDEMEEQLSPSDQRILERASRWQKGEPLPFLKDLKDLKERLLYKVIPKPEYSIEKPRADVLELIAEVSSLMNKGKITDRKNAILADFLHELENNPEGIREAIEDYNFVFAATVQHAAGREMYLTKTKYNQDSIRFDTVIVDEAARTSPRDLLIPMAQAEKRIILVGDRRQLPHLIDEEISRKLDEPGENNNEKNIDFYKKSMFEYLFRRLKNLEKEDGIKRTVTLDAQYRTHPILGNFVSDNFYRQYGEAYESPLPAIYFSQNLSKISGKAAIWINVTHVEGKEERLSNKSRQRKIEAVQIAKYLSEWINSEEGKKLNFGVISFYKAQVYAVYEALSDYGITERSQDGSWQITPEYAHLENGEERLRIGTVDSFQGMEFDIVFLSMVRSQDLKHHSMDGNYVRTQRRIFGHLMSENRLCVSMSRQKKALILVGDGNLVNSEIGAEAVPALKNYYKLCLDKGVIL